VLSVNPSIGTTFNQSVMSQEFEKIGMIYTDENKNSVSDFRTLSEVSFLKRGFKRDHDLGFWTAPLNPPSIIECFNWIHKTSNEREIIEQNIEMAGLELSLHPKQYDNITNKIKLVVKKNYNFLPVFPDAFRTRVAIRDNTALECRANIQWV